MTQQIHEYCSLSSYYHDEYLAYTNNVITWKS